MTNPNKGTLLASAVAMTLVCGAASAASISYTLSKANDLPDGIDYLRVTLADGADGAVDFTVETLSPLNDIADDDFGIVKFGFNVDAGVGAEAASVTGLPDHWKALDSRKLNDAGRYDIVVKAKHKAEPTSVLNFSITGVDFDELMDYAVLSNGVAPEGHALFAAKVVDFEFMGDMEEMIDEDVFYGSTSSTVVPLPATVWLLGSAGMLLAGIARRR